MLAEPSGMVVTLVAVTKPLINHSILEEEEEPVKEQERVIEVPNSNSIGLFGGEVPLSSAVIPEKFKTIQ